MSRRKFFILFLFLVLLGIMLNNKKVLIQTVALPEKNKVIVLDAGHGMPDSGASGKNNITEANINLQIVLKVQKLLEKNGYTVILTRTDENGIYDETAKTIRQKKISDIKNRVKIGNESNADIFISVHLNKTTKSKYWGWQTFYKKNNEESKMLASFIQKGLNESIKKKNKRKPLTIENIYIVDNIKVPISIVECGFLSNEEEEKLLATDDYQDKIAWGILLGIENYYTK